MSVAVAWPRMAARPTQIERAVSTHEASHCTLAHFFGYCVDSVRIGHLGGPGGEHGRFEFNDGPRTDGDAWKFERPGDMACIFMAGYIAERRVMEDPFPWDNSAVDMGHVRERVSGSRNYYRLARRTVRLVERLWPWIETLADALLVSRSLNAADVAAALAGCPKTYRSKRPW